MAQKGPGDKEGPGDIKGPGVKRIRAKKVLYDWIASQLLELNSRKSG